MQGELKYHWLVAGNVVAAASKGQVGQRGLNTLVTTDRPIFTRTDMAAAQEGLMRRFLEQTQNDRAGKIVDVFLITINNLGQMTREEFDGAFAGVGTKLETHSAPVT